MNIHQLIAADPNIAPEFKAAMDPTYTATGSGDAMPKIWFHEAHYVPPYPLPFYRPACGRWGRVYLSQADADAYTAAWMAWPATPDFHTAIGPAWDAVNDCDADQQARDDARADAAAEQQERDE